VGEADNKGKEITMAHFHVPDMGCGGCVSTIERVVKKLDPEARVAADLGAKTVAIETPVSVETLQEALKKAGFPATLQAAA